MSDLKYRLAIEAGHAEGFGADASELRKQLAEIQIERDEQAKALSLLQEVRQREKAEHSKELELARNRGGEYAEQIR